MRFVEYGRSTRRGRGEFYTPYDLAKLIAQITCPKPGDWLLEPAAGAGALMLASLEACREQHGVEAAHGLTMVGIELPGMSALVCRMNLVLAGAAQQSVVFAGNALK